MTTPRIVLLSTGQHARINRLDATGGSYDLGTYNAETETFAPTAVALGLLTMPGYDSDPEAEPVSDEALASFVVSSLTNRVGVSDAEATAVLGN